MSKNESEINFDNPILKNARFCRRIVRDGKTIIDPAWREKIDWETKIYNSEGGYLLSRRRSEVPNGTKVQFELPLGSNMSQYVDTSAIEVRKSGSWIPIHVCTREMGNSARYGIDGRRMGWDGVVKGGHAKGMKYVLVRADDIEHFKSNISEYMEKS
ncbi:MAG: hypothetical protein US75_C0050G0001 [Candidatus Woesebacteria bacterium GW2011_GWC1_38_13]|uniref:Uncharacterized protein n=2 Tax=Candidatus Woeseibacteriota TaxID=1752722 RepID=A0A0G0KQT4_9BACT|nr:MAG: hypothetical protein US75_C0050G0001 [Candidatus Woesebacteria bacterium GW2011_GWC1_38_13]KKQ82013.1 MAG: hypothetical protein UT06_C0052G0002 [Candidatus Woesebacteria bacterium GW2011_GWA1_38_8]